jgi:hypothetical protein
VTFRPATEMTSIAFRARADYNVDSATEIFADHVVPVAGCP